MPNIIEKGKEVVQSLMPTKAGLESAVNSAKDMVVGSGKISEEIQRFGKDYIDIPTSAISTPLKALGNIVELNPIGAIQELMTGVKNVSSKTIDIGLSPVRGAIAVGGSAGKAVKSVVSAPVKGVLAIGKAIGDKIKTPVKAVTESI